MAKRRALGRGLDALLGPSAGQASGTGRGSPKAGTGESKAGDWGSGPPVADGLREVPIDLLQRGKYQPRVRMDEAALAELTESIRAQGVVQPIVIRPIEGGDGEARFEIIAGERRWRAAQAAGLDTIPAVVRDVEDDAALAMALIENIQREDLNPIEEALALSRLVAEFELTHQAAADAVGRSRASVSNLLRLLELNPDVRTLLEDGELDMGHARAPSLGLKGAEQSVAARTVVSKQLTARQTEQLVRRMREVAEGRGEEEEVGAAEGGATKNPDVHRLEQELAEKLGAKVSIRYDRSGKGSLNIGFSSLEEFDGLLARIH